MVHEFEHPPLCIHLYHNHFTALMYRSADALEKMHVPIKKDIGQFEFVSLILTPYVLSCKSAFLFQQQFLGLMYN